MKIIVLGSGLVGAPMAMDLAKDHQFQVSIADKSQSQLDRVPTDFPIQKWVRDLSDTNQLKELVKDFDLVLNAVPGFMGFQTLKSIIEVGKDVVDISFFPEDPFQLHQLALEKNVIAIMDCGVAPGMSYILAAYAAKKMDKCERIAIYVGGLPKIRIQPFEYKAVFSPIDVIEEYTRPSRFKQNNEIVIKPALSDLESMDFDGIGTLEAFNSDGLRSLLQTIDCPDMIEKTLRYPGHVDKMKFLREMGLFSENVIDVNGVSIRPIDLTAKLMFPMWELKAGEEDLTVMKIIVSGQIGGKTKTYTYYLFDSFDTTTQVHSMARTTGYTATMAVRMLAASLYSKRGISPPEYIGDYPECVQFLLDGLKERNVVYRESIREE
ncbi:MAG: saccharopine dehydrogenase [Bacteroidetes bacterium]|jgi:lysine 6-dehydrogenase|nr:saccharopine dehydrogenase [Bacteroidota bacterium]MBT5530373.1 saccharopine dehydrogenase [Cytophagia bacterium]MBT3424456.1 saccharopine dehydrogenase [Bacteroidota bacterium]MBT3801895.1 saccharopine dehydrogenase [Bacteroidota bacterium]MBT3935094.1 saccharopine dehydrogenase [Bacteroidota bacterium]